MTSIRLKSRFEHGRVFVEYPARDGPPFECLADTCAGLVLNEKVVEIFKLPKTPFTAFPATEHEKEGDAVPFPAVMDQALFPMPRGPRRLVKSHATASVPERHALVSPAEGHLASGLLGECWFGGRVWTIDYVKKEFWWHPSDEAPQEFVSGAVSLPMYFQCDAEGKRLASFPVIEIEIDGAPLPMLLDTGLTNHLTDSALAELNDGLPSVRAGSFINVSLVHSLKAKHPNWRILRDTYKRFYSGMMQVESMRTGNVELGPLWLTALQDNAQTYDPDFSGRTPKGLLGGNAFQNLALTLDYIRGVAHLQPR
jgi:hypothetical protein